MLGPRTPTTSPVTSMGLGPGYVMRQSLPLSGLQGFLRCRRAPPQRRINHSELVFGAPGEGDPVRGAAGARAVQGMDAGPVAPLWTKPRWPTAGPGRDSASAVPIIRPEFPGAMQVQSPASLRPMQGGDGGASHAYGGPVGVPAAKGLAPSRGGRRKSPCRKGGPGGLCALGGAATPSREGPRGVGSRGNRPDLETLGGQGAPRPRRRSRRRLDLRGLQRGARRSIDRTTARAHKFRSGASTREGRDAWSEAGRRDPGPSSETATPGVQGHRS